tara:strand:- start:1924 stop:3333 length:1410 start_codon:yes stop_codon:yes gene_type:complete
MLKSKNIRIYLTFFITLFILILLFFNFKIIASKIIPNRILDSLKIIKNASIYIDKIKENEKKLKETNSRFQKITSGINTFESSIYKQKTFFIKENKTFEFKKFLAPFLAYDNYGQKPVAYADTYKEDIVLVSGDGKFYLIESLNKEDNKIYFKRIKSNLDKILKNNSLYLEGWFSIKDLLLYDKKVYISLNNEIEKNCFNTSIFVASYDSKELLFENFFNPKDCLIVDSNGVKYGPPKDAEKELKKIVDTKYSEANAHQSGGKMSILDNNILLSIGDYRYRELAQDDNSLFGKIIKINLDDNKNVEIFSKGHRNPQGLIFYDKKKIISTEHGPKGGDEINLITKNGNYGWPISSYGEHYDGKFRENAPLNKSHKKFGFKEPIEYFNPSIGISDLIKIQNNFIKNVKDSFFVASLKKKTLYIFGLNETLNKVEELANFSIGERIRDFTYLENSDIYVMVLEDSPSIGIIY